MLDPAAVERIRAIFLHQRPHVTIAEATQMLGWSFGQMEDAIRGGEIEVTADCSGPVIELRELAEKALQLWPMVVIEAALGRDAKLVLPPALRTRKLVLRLPAYQIEALRLLAGDGSETVEEFVTRTFEELADLHRDRLEPHISGFAEAIAWPEEPLSSQAIDTN
jgi:hypothetical protein